MECLINKRETAYQTAVKLAGKEACERVFPYYEDNKKKALDMMDVYKHDAAGEKKDVFWGWSGDTFTLFILLSVVVNTLFDNTFSQSKNLTYRSQHIHCLLCRQNQYSFGSCNRLKRTISIQKKIYDGTSNYVYFKFLNIPYLAWYNILIVMLVFMLW